MVEPIARAEVIEIVKRLEAADQYHTIRLDAHIAEYRRESADMKSNVNGIDLKVDMILENQQKIKGRDGVFLIVAMAVVQICIAVIAASILGVI